MPTPTKRTAAAPPPGLARSPDAARRCDYQSHPTANPSLRLLSAVAVASVMLIHSVPFCSCQTVNSADVSRINKACSNCDTRFLSMVTSFQNNFNGSIEVNASATTPLELGNAHCRRFSQIGSCYVDCLEGLPITYTSNTKRNYQSFYAQFCDPQCQLSFIPACYNAAGVPYTLYRTGCDEDKLKIRSSISACMELWFGKQNCAGLCNAGARAAFGLKLQLEAICEIPGWEYECPTVLATCIEDTYGPYGAVFFGGESSLTGSGSSSCRKFDGAFSSCLSNTINGSVVFGTPPYDVTYDQPCASYRSAVSDLLQLSKNITYPLCSNPERDFASICPSPASTTVAYTTTVPASTSSAATPTPALSTLASSTKAIASVTTASPATSTAVASSLAVTTAISSTKITTASPGSTIGSTAFSPEAMARIKQACSRCDSDFLSLIYLFQNSFTKIVDDDPPTVSPLELGNLHCRRFSQIGSCYVDCMEGIPITYSSEAKRSYQTFYTQFCNPQCQLSFLPACYIAEGMPYTLYRSGCDEDNLKIRSGISTCMELWLGKQNCTGVCNAGARAASGLKLQLQSICGVPSSEYECSTVLATCIEQSYGPYGALFFGGDSALTGSGSSSCWNFNGAFSSCLYRSMNGSFVFGDPPYDSTYSQPCAYFPGVVSDLLQLSENMTFPLCSNPERDFASICASPAFTTGASTKTLPASTSTAATPKPAVSTLAPSTETITSITTASPATSTSFVSTSVAPSGTVTRTNTTATRVTGVTTVEGNTIVRTTGATIQIAASTVVASPAGSTAQRLTTSTMQTIRTAAAPAAATSNGYSANQTSTRSATDALVQASTSFSSVSLSTKYPSTTFTSPAGSTIGSAAFSPEVTARITQACSRCDTQFMSTVASFQDNFMGSLGVNSSTMTPLELGNLHCRRFSQIGSCYVDCLEGLSISYTSTTKSNYQSFYAQFCDPQCQLSFMPACYIADGVSYSLYLTGCDEGNLKIRSGISTCMELWFGKQNCAGICSTGARAASGLKLHLQLICGVPSLEYECPTTLETCIEQTYGAYGALFFGGGPALTGSGNSSCWNFDGAFASCLSNSINGSVVFGTPPYDVSYDQPCASYRSAVSDLLQLSKHISYPLCSNPERDFASICPSPASTPSASATAVPASTSSAATPTPALSTLASSTKAITSVTTASPATSTAVASSLAVTTAISSTKSTTASTVTSPSFVSTSVAPSGTVSRTNTTATRGTGFTTVEGSTIVRTTGSSIQVATSTVVASPAGSTAQRLPTSTEQTIRTAAAPATATTSSGYSANQTSARSATAALVQASTSFSSVTTSTKSPTTTFTNTAGLAIDSTAFSPEVMARITQACGLCDGNYTIYLNDFQRSFYKGFDERTSDPMTIADFHCSRMSSAMQCYKDCVQGHNVVYVSKEQKELSQFYKQFCDADCRMAFLPHCFLSQRLEYSLYRTGCDDDLHQLNNELKPGVLSCIDYWAGTQHCSGICTAGQRALSTMKLMLETTCRIPTRADDCGTSVNFCMEETFGAYGANFILSNDVLVSPTSVTCSQFSGAFKTCLDQALNGQLTIGCGPQQYRTLYNTQPCSQYADAIDYLSALATDITAPLCDDDPSLNVTAYCEQAMLQATTHARTAATTVRATFVSASRTTTRKTAVPSTASTPPVADATTVGGDDELPTDDSSASPVGGSSTKRKSTTTSASSSASTRLPSTEQGQGNAAGERLRSSHDLLLLLLLAAVAAAAASATRLH